MQTLIEKTLTEQTLCKLWARADATGDWWEMYAELADIADVLSAAGQAEGAELFADAAKMALDRRMYQLRMATA